MDCSELRSRIEQSDAFPTPLTIALGSTAYRIQIKKLLENGFQSHLFKPLIRPSLLAQSLTEAIAAEANTPVEKAEDKKPAAKPKSIQKEAAPKRFHVLLAEDHPVNQKLAKRLLNKIDCEIEIANNGQEAIEMATSKRYDAIFMDCQMPEMGDLEATGKIRKIEQSQGLSGNENRKRIPIIAITAGAMEGDREICVQSGMDDYLTKPLKVTELKSAVERWCQIQAGKN